MMALLEQDCQYVLITKVVLYPPPSMITWGEGRRCIPQHYVSAQRWTHLVYFHPSFQNANSRVSPVLTPLNIDISCFMRGTYFPSIFTQNIKQRKFIPSPQDTLYYPGYTPISPDSREKSSFNMADQIIPPTLLLAWSFVIMRCKGRRCEALNSQLFTLPTLQ